MMDDNIIKFDDHFFKKELVIKEEDNFEDFSDSNTEEQREDCVNDNEGTVVFNTNEEGSGSNSNANRLTDISFSESAASHPPKVLNGGLIYLSTDLLRTLNKTQSLKYDSTKLKTDSHISIKSISEEYAKIIKQKQKNEKEGNSNNCIEKIVPPNKKFKSDKCVFLSESKLNIQKHLKSHLPKEQVHTCKKCHLATASESELNMHIKILHSTDGELSISQYNEPNFLSNSHLYNSSNIHIDNIPPILSSSAESDGDSKSSLKHAGKKKLKKHQLEEPLTDEEEEKKRLNAKKAYESRKKKKEYDSQREQELEKLRSRLLEIETEKRFWSMEKETWIHKEKLWLRESEHWQRKEDLWLQEKKLYLEQINQLLERKNV